MWAFYNHVSCKCLTFHYFGKHNLTVCTFTGTKFLLSVSTPVTANFFRARAQIFDNFWEKYFRVDMGILRSETGPWCLASSLLGIIIIILSNIIV
jgi:hypothetical protein